MTMPHDDDYAPTALVSAPPATALPVGSAGPLAPPLSILPPDTTDEVLIDLWLKGKSPETVRAYQTDVALFRQVIPRPLQRVTLADLHTFAEGLAALEDASIKRRMSAVKSLFSFAHKTGYVAYNVGVAYQPPRLPDDLAERILTEEQVQRLLALEPNRRNHALLRLLYSGGLRVSEVVGLTWAQCHAREDGRCQLTVHGKGGKTRHVLVTAATWAEVQHLCAEDTRPEDPLFRSRGANGHRGGGLLDSSQVQRIVAAAAKRAGIQGNVSPHWLRHAHASHALDRGAPIHLVRATLGHGSLAVTGRYAHARPATSSSDYLPV